jgi:hypothetical protein
MSEERRVKSNQIAVGNFQHPCFVFRTPFPFFYFLSLTSGFQHPETWIMCNNLYLILNKAENANKGIGKIKTGILSPLIIHRVKAIFLFCV